MTDSTVLFLNTKLERYQILERLGSGGMARVYKGRDTNLDRPVAIKVLHEHLSDDPLFVERFEREAKFVAAFNHPNIVQIYDFNWIERGDQKIAYMVMSYIPGKTLADVLAELHQNNELMPQDQVLGILMDLCGALGYAHDLGMVHRDVKPANILFDQQGRAVLTDFGIARLVENSKLTQEGVTVGTPAYMSPEQATGQSIDARSDIYSLGIIAYEMLAGQPPFADDGSLSVLLKHLNEQAPPLSNYPHIKNSYLDIVIARALAKIPDDRYQTAHEFMEDLKKAFDGILPESAQLPGTSGQSASSSATALLGIAAPPPVPAHRTSGSPLAILAVGMTVIAVLLLLGLLNQQNGNSERPSVLTQNTENQVDAMVAMPIYFNTSFQPDETYTQYWPQGSSNNLTRSILPDGGYRIQNNRRSQAVASIFEPGADYFDLTIRLVARLEEGSSPPSGYGIAFRYVDDDNYNVFAVDGVGRFSIWVRNDGQWHELRSDTTTWTSSEAVNPLGETNELLLEIYGDELSGYVNGIQVTSVIDDTIATGKLGIYVASTTDANTTVLVEQFEVTEPSTSMTGSVDAMTCEGRGRCLDEPTSDTPEDG